MRSCNELCNYFWIKEWNIIGSKTPHIITNWEPYFVVYFQITLVSQRHSSVLVEKHAHFMLMIELSIGPCMCYTRRISVITVTVLPFDQMEPSHSMQTRSGNPVRTPNRNGVFPTSELNFTRGFMNELMTDWWRIVINNILPLPESILDYSFKSSWSV